MGSDGAHTVEATCDLVNDECNRREEGAVLLLITHG